MDKNGCPRYPLYHECSQLWPVVSPPDSYAESMEEWIHVVSAHFRPFKERSQPLRILDLGSGGAHHLRPILDQLAMDFSLVLVDQSKEMLRQAAARVPEAETIQADMTGLALQREFDLILVHDSFCYLTELEELSQLAQVLTQHLAEDGLALIQVDTARDCFQGPYRYLTNFEHGDGEVSVVHYEWDPDPSDRALEVVYLFMERQGPELKVREERHRLGLFSKEELLGSFNTADIGAEFVQLSRWDEDRENLLLKVTWSPTRSQPGVSSTRRIGCS